MSIQRLHVAKRYSEVVIHNGTIYLAGQLADEFDGDIHEQTRQTLANIDKMPQSTFDEIIEKYVEMNIAHPFREGNGRSTRIWLDHILKTEIGKVVDWSKVDKEDYLLAMERSPIKDVKIKALLKVALTVEINSREVYLNGIDQSYYYEGFTAFRAGDL